MKRITNKLELENEYMNIKIYPAIYKGMDVYFTDDRVKIPNDKGIYKYEVRHDNGTPIEISEHIAVDFYGTILSLEPIDLPKPSLFIFEFDDIKIGDFYITDYNNPITILDLIVEDLVDGGKDGHKIT